MLFVVKFEDVYSEQPERASHMADHLAFLAENGNQVVAAGALRLSGEGTPLGGIWILNVGNKAGTEALYKDIPFWMAACVNQFR